MWQIGYLIGLTAIALATAFAPPANARPQAVISAEELHRACSQTDAAPNTAPASGNAVRRPVRNAECTRFLNGLVHTLRLAQQGFLVSQRNARQFMLNHCIQFPNGSSSIAELRDIIVNYGERHAELLNMPAFDFAARALAAWYPCGEQREDEIPARFQR